MLALFRGLEYKYTLMGLKFERERLGRVADRFGLDATATDETLQNLLEELHLKAMCGKTRADFLICLANTDVIKTTLSQGKGIIHTLPFQRMAPVRYFSEKYCCAMEIGNTLWGMAESADGTDHVNAAQAIRTAYEYHRLFVRHLEMRFSGDPVISDFDATFTISEAEGLSSQGKFREALSMYRYLVHRASVSGILGIAAAGLTDPYAFLEFTP